VHIEFRKRDSPLKTRILKRFNINKECKDIPEQFDPDDNWIDDTECGDTRSGEGRATHVAGTAAGLYTGLATEAAIVSVAVGSTGWVQPVGGNSLVVVAFICT